MTTLDESTARADSSSIDSIREAANSLRLAKASHNGGLVAIAQTQLRCAVEAANDAGVTWQVIGDTLEIRRGNAYQRYRRRPGMTRRRGAPPL